MRPFRKPLVSLHQHLLRAAGRAPLSRHHRALRQDIVQYGWRMSLIGFLNAWLFYFVVSQTLALSFPVSIFVALLFMLMIHTFVEYGAHVLTLRHLDRLPRSRRRTVARLKAPYDRMAPVATAFCSECKAQPNTRHDRTCGVIPAGWYKNRPLSGS